MRAVYRILIALAFLFAALMCYSFGLPAGGAIFLILGIAFEGAFWITLFGRRRARRG
ncbi:hypothetical protein [Pseudohongiella sp.]|uniref:Uncharacterized protein n=1 Tax=marine sediment metagenome TaxID=412755 RepID=A0A0F9VVE0_9ZZZZ|nr:hypothetical protein [Pseudohongiella sp.]